jgi:hypothetical protein
VHSRQSFIPWLLKSQSSVPQSRIEVSPQGFRLERKNGNDDPETVGRDLVVSNRRDYTLQCKASGEASPVVKTICFENRSARFGSRFATAKVCSAVLLGKLYEPLAF